VEGHFGGADYADRSRGTGIKVTAKTTDHAKIAIYSDTGNILNNTTFNP
jgi:hypothetical protein